MSKMQTHKDLGQLLLEEGLINERQLQAARAAQMAQEKSIGRALVDMGLITEQAKMTFLHKKFKYEIVDISGVQAPERLLARISRAYAERHRCVPILVEKDRLVVAMEDPTDLMVCDEIKAQTGMDVLPVLAPIADIENLLHQFPATGQAAETAAGGKGLGSATWRLLHPAVFLVVLVLPLFAFFGSIYYDIGGISDWTRRQGTYNTTLYVILTWALWAILVWEIDGLFFKSEEGKTS